MKTHHLHANGPASIQALLEMTGNVGLVPADQVKDLEDGSYAMAKPLLFHWTVIRGAFDDPIGYFDRWCFASRELALAALADFPVNPSDDYDPPGWHRHPPSGRRRDDADPSTERFDP